MPSYNISEEAQEIIKQKTEQFNDWGQNITELDVLEYMVMEFGPSSVEDTEKQRKQARDEWLESGNKSIRSAWTNGWYTGWNHFQSRKKSYRVRRRSCW